MHCIVESETGVRVILSQLGIYIFYCRKTSGVRIPMANSGSGAAAVGQQPGSSGASDVNTATTIEQQLIQMTKEIGCPRTRPHVLLYSIYNFACSARTTRNVSPLLLTSKRRSYSIGRRRSLDSGRRFSAVAAVSSIKSAFSSITRTVQIDPLSISGIRVR